jgi:hypothetical protein
LLDNPANLTGYGPIDPELARLLATDATWQTIIARARRAATGQPTPRNEPEDLPAGYVPPPAAPPRPVYGPLRFPPTPMNSAGKLITRTLAQVRAGAILAGIDGHGGHTEPPPGALIYRPSKELSAAVRQRYATCTHPGCSRPARKCEIDHAVPFNHADPLRGGWTVLENLAPRCKFHHQLHTNGHHKVFILPDGIVVTVSQTGAVGVTLPDALSGGNDAPQPEPEYKPAPEWDVPPDDDPTWWEQHMRPESSPPSLGEIAAMPDAGHRSACHVLRGHHTEHLSVLTRRQKHAAAHAPAPF